MVTVQVTSDRELNTAADIFAYLEEVGNKEPFNVGDKVRIKNRNGINASAFAGDVGIVGFSDTPGSPFVNVRGLYSNGNVVQVQVPAANLELYVEASA